MNFRLDELDKLDGLNRLDRLLAKFILDYYINL
jgi:hypothetical protein